MCRHHVAIVSCVILVLWDVDHTLIENGGVSKETYGAAYQIFEGRPAHHRARTEGRTDPEIMRDLLEQHGIAVTADHEERLIEVLTAAMNQNADALRQRGWALPGGLEAIHALREQAGIVQSVLSGNIRHNAFVKLATFGLHEHLDWDAGAFGSDGNERPALVAVAQARARRRYGVEFGLANTVLIGDTVRDVGAGRDGGARVVAVATGSDTVEQLRQAGADQVLPDLRNTRALVAAVMTATAN
jgi:phosphoglycolate phosphatase